MSTGNPYAASPYEAAVLLGWLPTSDAPPLVQQNHQLAAENAQLRAEMARREEQAYEHGLGDHAKVYRENRILAATIAALVDRQHEARVR